jgi:hypothetical protein
MRAACASNMGVCHRHFHMHNLETFGSMVCDCDAYKVVCAHMVQTSVTFNEETKLQQDTMQHSMIPRGLCILVTLKTPEEQKQSKQYEKCVGECAG